MHLGPPPLRRGRGRDRLEGERRAMGPRWIEGGVRFRGEGGEESRRCGPGTGERRPEQRGWDKWGHIPAQTRAERDVVADATLGEMELKEWAAVVVGGMSRQTLK